MPYADPIIAKQKAAEYYLRNRELLLARATASYASNRDAKIAYQKARYLETRVLKTVDGNPSEAQLAYWESKKGVPPHNKGSRWTRPHPNKGIVFPDEVRLRMSLAHKGKLPNNKGKKSSICGERHSNWKGGVTPENEKQRKSLEYREWRTSVFKRDDYTCVICGAKNGLGRTVKLNADHILPFATHKEHRFDVSNGRTLCVPCHRKTDTYGRPSKKRAEDANTVFFNPSNDFITLG